VIDECHRGSAKEDSAWREVLEYFSSATQIGMTATPKETKEVSNIHYFGEPIYTYSLKQGIEDGFLAPYKVVRYRLDKDILGFRPEGNQRDMYENIIEDREYYGKDFERSLVLIERRKRVAKIISEYMKENDRYMKTIVFCENIEHAEEMTKYLAMENSDLMKINPKYVMTITGDNPEGKAQLDNFIDPNSKYPVIATTSKLLTTGVDAKTCKFIVLDSNINSMTEFKQIVGRGTRVDEEHDKTWFTVLDFREVSRLFADPDFDGEPIQDEEFVPKSEKEDEEEEDKNPEFPTSEDDEVGDDGEVNDGDFGFDDEERIRKKFYVDGVEVRVLHKQVQLLGADGKLITKSFVDYSKDEMKKSYQSYDEFLKIWTQEGQRKIIVGELEERGIDFETLKEEIGTDLDEFDIICHLAFDKKPITKKQRADRVRKSKYLEKYQDTAKEILEILLEKYSDGDSDVFEDIKVLQLPQFRKFGTLPKIMKIFGSKDNFENIMHEITKEIYL